MWINNRILFDWPDADGIAHVLKPNKLGPDGDLSPANAKQVTTLVVDDRNRCHICSNAQLVGTNIANEAPNGPAKPFVGRTGRRRTLRGLRRC